MIHTTHMLPTSVHICHSYASYGLSPDMATFHANPKELDRFTAPEKKCSRLYLSARLSGPWDPPQFLSQHNHWSSAFKLRICWWTNYISLLGPYLQHVISMFNTFSWGPTHRPLTDTGRGYNLEGANVLNHCPHPFQPTVLHFPLMAAPGLRLIIQPLSTELKREQILNLVSETLHSTSTII
jgi:hypothetical protein